MAEEDSFVILGSSPVNSISSHTNSLLTDAIDGVEPDGALNEPVQSSSQQQSVLTDKMETAENSLPATLPSGQSSLAASFLLGEVKADVLMNSVYSQFPSLCSMQACAEDVVKLQAMMTEHLALKQSLAKVSHTLQSYYEITQKWRSESAAREKQYQEQLEQCQTKIDTLVEENEQLKKDTKANMEQLRLAEEVHQKDYDELRKYVSEKDSLINNLRVEIDRLEKLQMVSFEYVPEEVGESAQNYKTDDLQVKNLQRQMSILLTENLELKDMKNTYIDEINCLKVNLTSAEEIINAMRADIAVLKAKDTEKKEQIDHLMTQVDTYRHDFEMERADREKNAGEKEQYLLDLRALQRRNHELIQALSESQKSNKFTSRPPGISDSASGLRSEQRPVLDPTGAAAKTSDSLLRCPICSKSFTALTVLQSHVNDCLDEN